MARFSAIFRIGLIIGLWVFMCFGGFSISFAQETETETQAPPAAEQSAVEQPNPEPEPVNSEEAPSLEEAYKALNEAERAFLEAAKAQAGADLNADAPIIEAETPAEEKSSLFSDPDAIMDMVRSAGDKIFGWLTSLPFLAMVGAIILAFFLAPFLARLTRKRVFLFRDPPAEDVKLKIVRDYVFRSGTFLRAVFLVLLLAIFAAVLKAIPAFGEDWLVKLAQSVAVVFLLYRAIKEFVTNDLFEKNRNLDDYPARIDHDLWVL